MIYQKDKNLQHLVEPAKSRIIEFINTWNNWNPNLKIWVAETLRTKELQAYYLKTWATKTMNSNHLKGLAVDIYFNIPWDIYLEKRSDWPTIWKNLCNLANVLWLVNWYYNLNWWFDKPHFQIRECQKPIWKITDWYKKAMLYKKTA